MLDNLLATGHLTVLIPLMVINELDGLKKGYRGREQVTQQATEAMTYLQSKVSPSARLAVRRKQKDG